MSETTTATPPLVLEPRPFVCQPLPIEPSWIDYNGHLNMAYYNVLFDRSLDQFMDMLGVGWRYLKERNCSTMTAECHVRYLREIKLGDPVHVTVLIVAADDKRIHYFEELRHSTEDWVSATSENMTLHIDMNLRRVAPFPPDILARVKAVAAAHAKAPPTRRRWPAHRDACTKVEFWLVSWLYSAAADHAEDRRQQKQHDGDEEDHFRELDRYAGNAAKTQQTRDQRDHEKRHNPA